MAAKSATLREYVLIDPSRREVEVFTRNESGAWLLTDQTHASELPLACIDCRLAVEWVFKGVEA